MYQKLISWYPLRIHTGHQGVCWDTMGNIDNEVMEISDYLKDKQASQHISQDFIAFNEYFLIAIEFTLVLSR